MSHTTSRRDFLKQTAAAGAALGLVQTGRISAEPAAPTHQRVIILGFDGVEPSVVETMLQKGELPNLAKLKETGCFHRLHTANPPQSPTAWTSFATCKNPGGHGIYDFLRRDPRRYMPAVGLGYTVHPKLGIDGSVSQPARSVTHRKGDTFWAVADRQGTRATVLTVPFIYPPDKLEESQMLCGLGVPDIRGTTSTCFSFSDSFSPAQLEERMSGGERIPLSFENDVADVKLPAARDPRSRSVAYIDVPVSIKVDRTAHAAAIEVEGKHLELKEGDWSDWVEWNIEVTPLFAVKALSRFYVIEVGEKVRLYMTCHQFHPRDAYVPFTAPEEYSSELADRYGLYKTIGWSYDTHALRQDALTEKAFLEDIERTMAWREQLALDELDRDRNDLFVAAWTATDRVGHMFWRFRDPGHPLYTEAGAKEFGRVIEDTYIRMDKIVGKVTERVREGDLVMVLSDHGFKSFRTGFNVNTWLIRNGYLAVEDMPDPETAFNEKAFLAGYDWSKTKAYALGLGSIFLNLRGREGQGLVDPSQAGALLEELRGKLLEVTDPATGAKVFTEIYTRDVYSGVARADAPDLVLGFADYYQSGKASVKGAAPKELFEPNDDKWSGEHAAADVAKCPGIFFCNQAVTLEDPDIRDLGVTALACLGKDVPSDMEGRRLV